MAGVPRPKGFSPAQAQKWVLMSAFITLAVYVVRRLTEAEASPAPATNAARAFLGQGSPPNTAQWLIAWSTSMMGLAILAAIAPELAGALAMLTVLVTFLESGNQLATDLRNLEHGAGLPGVPIIGSTNDTAATAPDLSGTPVASLAAGDSQPYGTLTNPFGVAPDPHAVGAAAAATATQQKIVDEYNALPSPEGYSATIITRGGQELVQISRFGKIIFTQKGATAPKPPANGGIVGYHYDPASGQMVAN